MQESGNSIKLREGITIGIGINSEYNYQTKTGGPTLTKKISDSEEFVVKVKSRHKRFFNEYGKSQALEMFQS